MAFTNLTSYSQDAYQRLPNYGQNILYGKNPQNSPDSRVNVVLGFWVSPTVIAFTVTTANGASSGLGIDQTTSDMLDLNVFVAPGAATTTTYWTVDVGSDDSSGTNWTISITLEANSTKTGTWVFTKAKSPEDKYKEDKKLMA